MLDKVPSGEELMPHRQPLNITPATEAAACDSEAAALPTTPIRKLTRNRGLVVQEETVVEDSPEIEDGDPSRGGAIRKCKRKLRWEHWDGQGSLVSQLLYSVMHSGIVYIGGYWWFHGISALVTAVNYYWCGLPPPFARWPLLLTLMI